MDEGLPKPLFSDFVEMVYLFGIIVVATPPNIIILRRLLAERRRTPRDSVRAGFLLLKINLNISDLLILFIVAFGRLLWLITYNWRGGEALCRVFNFLCMFAMYFSSNIVVCIALDRLRNVLGASRIRRSNASTVRALVLTSWFLAVVFALPQLYVWTVVDLAPNSTTGWMQCSDVWSINLWRIEEMQRLNQTPPPEFILNQIHSTYYNIFHLFVVFWGPVIVLVICYFTIAIRLTQYTLKAPGSQATTIVLRQDETSVALDHSPTKTQRDSISLFGIHELCAGADENGVCMNADGNLLPPPRGSGASNHRRCNSQKYTHSRDRSGAKFSSTSAPLQRLSLGVVTKKLSLPRAFFRRSNSSTGVSDRTSASVPVPRLPSWRRQLRSKVFRTTLLVVLSHVILWFPYNFQAIVKYVNEALFNQLSDHANVFKDLQFLITLINPFLYGFLYN